MHPDRRTDMSMYRVASLLIKDFLFLTLDKMYEKVYESIINTKTMFSFYGIKYRKSSKE